MPRQEFRWKPDVVDDGEPERVEPVGVQCCGMRQADPAAGLEHGNEATVKLDTVVRLRESFALDWL